MEEGFWHAGSKYLKVIRRQMPSEKSKERKAKGKRKKKKGRRVKRRSKEKSPALKNKDKAKMNFDDLDDDEFEAKFGKAKARKKNGNKTEYV